MKASLKSQLILLIIFPSIVMTLVSLQHNYSFYNYFKEESKEEFVDIEKKIKANFMENIEKLSSLTESMALSHDIIDKLETEDIDGLDVSSYFYKQNNDYDIWFLNNKKRVLFRSNSPYKFNDRINVLYKSGSVQISSIDKKLYLFSVQQARNTLNQTVGSIIIGHPIDDLFLSHYFSPKESSISLIFLNYKVDSANFKESSKWTEYKFSFLLESINRSVDIVVRKNTLEHDSIVLNKFLTQLVIYFLILIVLLSIVIYYIKHIILNPINKLTDVMTNFSRDDKISTLEVSFNNEFNHIAIGLNKLQTELASRNEELVDVTKDLYKETKRLERDNVLLKTLCHDMANPITIIKTLTKRFNKFQPISDSKKYNETVEKLLKSIEISENVMSHVRDIIKSESDNLTIKLSPISIDKPIQILNSLFEDRLKEKSISFKFENEAKGIQFMAEETTFINNVLNNVMSNALKFTPVDGEIIIKYSLEGAIAHLEITNIGTAIPIKVAENLLHNKINVTTLGTEGEKGSGLGFSQVKKHMEYYGGKVDITSKNGQIPETTIHLYLKKY